MFRWICSMTSLLGSWPPTCLRMTKVSYMTFSASCFVREGLVLIVFLPHAVFAWSSSMKKFAACLQYSISRII